MAPQRQNVSCASCKERNKLASFVSVVLIQNTNNRVNKRSVPEKGEGTPLEPREVRCRDTTIDNPHSEKGRPTLRNLPAQWLPRH